MMPNPRRWTRLSAGPDPASVGKLLEQLEALGARNLRLYEENERLTAAVNATEAEMVQLRMRAEETKARLVRLGDEFAAAEDAREAAERHVAELETDAGAVTP